MHQLPATVTLSVKVTRSVAFPAQDVVAFMTRPDVVSYWLGYEAVLPDTPPSEVVLPDAGRADGRISYDYRSGVLVERGWHGGTFRLVVSWANADDPMAADDPTAQVTVRVTPAPGGTSRVRISESWTGPAGSEYPRLRLWEGCLNRLERILREALHRRDRIRQAVVVVHGIGEQRPGQTLRGFVEGVFPQELGATGFTKPDYVSPLFEMRTVSVPGDWSRSRPTTDVYELYWAHLIRDTTLPQVYSWLGRLLISRGRVVPRVLRPHVWALRVLITIVMVAAAALVATGTWKVWSAAFTAGVLALVPTLFWGLWRIVRNRFVLGFIGDAARYLEPTSDNVARRQEIRQAGADLLEALHAGGRYQRIVVFGHSLGSVIAYDILANSWARMSRRREEDDGPATLRGRALLDLEDLLNPRPGPAHDPPGAERIQEMQHAAWAEHRDNGFSWLVTDFVTAGSPLTHARWLLNLDRVTTFDALVEERTLPTSPPQTEAQPTGTPGRLRSAFTFTHAYPNEDRLGSRSVPHPNHAAVFALTRWTNLYFPWRGGFSGDPIGGPLRDTFGKWIVDIPLEPSPRGVAHNLYLRPTSATHVESLRKALQLQVAATPNSLIPELVNPASIGADS